MRNVRLATIALLIVTIPSAVMAEDQREPGSANLPSDVVDLIGRRSSCNDWAGVATENPNRAEEAERVRQVLKCEALAVDERALRLKYEGNPNVDAALDATWVRVIKRLPIQPK